MSLDTSINVTVGGIGEIQEAAAAFRELDTAADSAEEALGRPFEAAGMGAIADSAQAAAASVDAAAGTIVASLGQIDAAVGSSASGLGALGDAGKGLGDIGVLAAGAADELKGLGAAAADSASGLGGAADAGKAVADAADAMTAPVAASADALKAQTAAAGDSADALKVQADAAKAQADTAKWAAETNSIAADANRAYAAASAEASLGIARSNAVQAESYASLGTTSVEQDAAVMQSVQARKLAAEDAASSAEASAGRYHMALLGGAVALGYGVDMAAKLQTGVTRLYTSAGESAKNLPMISQGILGMSGPTATSQASLLSGAYWAESAGFHGADALAVLKSGAQGAYSEGADLGTTENALTTTLNDYYGGPQKSAAKQQQQANAAMNAIMASVGAGKMTLQGLSTALPNLLPAAQQAHLTLAQALGAESTLTGEGMSSDQAAQDIRHTITSSLQKPSNVQSAEMQMLGINPLQLESSLGKQGLTGTIAEADAAIQKHTSDGMVQLDVMNQSKLAMQSANAAVLKLPESVRSVAEGYLSGKVTEAQWYGLTGTKSTLPVDDVNLLKQFASVANTALGFSSMIKAGQGDKQTQSAALNEMLGGQVGQAVALGLGGTHLDTFKADVDSIGKSAQTTGTNIRGWSAVQDTLNYKLKDFTYSLEAVATEAGQAALPALTKVLGGVSDVAGFAAAHQALTQDVMIGGGILALPALLSKVASPIGTILSSAGKVGETLGIPGAGKLAGIGQGAAGASSLDGAAGTLQAAGGSLEGAAGSLEGAAAKLGGAGVTGDAEGALQHGAAGAGGPVIPAAATADAEDTAEADAEKGGGGLLAALGLKGGTDIAGAVNPVGAGIGLGLVLKGIGDQLAPAGTNAGKVNAALQKTNTVSTDQAMPGIFGGFEAKLGLSGFGQDIGGAAGAIMSLFSGAPAANRLAGGGNDARFGSTSVPAPPAPASAPEGGFAGNGGWAGDTLKAGEKTAAQTVPVKVTPQIDAGDISGTLKHDLASLGSGLTPVKIPAPDLDALAAAKGKAAAAMAGIMSALHSGASGASSAGSAMDSGLAGGIAGGAGSVIAAAHAVAADAAAAMSAALDAHSPSRVTEGIGNQQFDLGFAEGIEGGAGKVQAAATGLSKSAAASLTAGLQGGAAAITTAKDLAAGITAPFSDSTIAGTITTAENDVAKALKDHKITASEDSGIVAWLKADDAKLQSLAQQRQSLEGQITQAQSYAQQITAAANQNASIVNVAGTAEATEAGNAPAAQAPPQVADLISGMKAQVAQTRQFTADLAKLKKEGLNSPELDQLAQAGASTGDPIAQSILGGGKGAIAELNKLQQQMNTAAKQLGVTASNAVYEPAADIGKGLAAGLKSQLGVVNSSISQLATQMSRDLNAALGGGAAAAAFKDGASIGKELAAGLASVSGDLTSAIIAALDTAEKEAAKKKKAKGSAGGGSDGTSAAYGGGGGADYSHPATAVPHPATAVPSGGGGGGGGGGGVTHQSTTHIVMDGQVVATSVTSHILASAANNLSSAVLLPHRTS